MLSAVLRHKQLRDESQNPNDPSDSPLITETGPKSLIRTDIITWKLQIIISFSSVPGPRDPSEMNGLQNAAGLIFQ